MSSGELHLSWLSFPNMLWEGPGKEMGVISHQATSLSSLSPTPKQVWEPVAGSSLPHLKITAPDVALGTPLPSARMKSATGFSPSDGDSFHALTHESQAVILIIVPFIYLAFFFDHAFCTMALSR